VSGEVRTYSRRVLGHTLEVSVYRGRDGIWRVSRVMELHTKLDVELLPLECDAAGSMCVRLDGRLYRLAGLFTELRRTVP
jgi:hypothetical protein